MSVVLSTWDRRHAPRRYEVGASFRLAWSAPARVETGMTEFVTVQGVACLRDDYRGFVEVGREPITDRDYRPWHRIDLPFDTDQFFANGDLAITTSDLDVFRWRPGELPTRWWAVPAAAATATNRSLSVRPIDDDLVLVQDYGQRRQTTLCRRTTDALSWVWQTTLSWSVRLDDHLIAVRTDRRGWVVSYELATGREEWALELAGDIKSLDIVGVVDGVMWFVGRGGLLAVDPIHGKTIREIRAGYRGLGTLELPGTYHICSPGYYCEYDLRNGGKPIVEIEYPRSSEYPDGSMGLLATDGRYLCWDDRGGLWVTRTDEARTRELVWRAPARVDRWTIAHGHVYAIDERKVMHCLSDASAPGRTYDPPPLVPELSTLEDDPEPPLSALWQSREALPIANPRRDSQGRLVGGTLTTDTVIDGLPCRGGQDVTFWIPDGWLENATLSREVDLTDFTLPAGSKFMTWDCGSIFHSVFPALDRVIHGVRIPAGSEVLLDEQTGRTVRMVFLGGELQLEARDEHGKLQHRRLANGDALYWQRGGWWFDMPEDS